MERPTAPPPARGRIRNRGWCVPRIPNRACRQRRCVEQVFGTAGGAAHSPDRKWYRIDPAPSQPRGAVTSEGDVAAASGEGATKRVAPEERAIAGSRDEHCRRACALSPVTRHPSPVTRHPSPVTRCACACACASILDRKLSTFFHPILLRPGEKHTPIRSAPTNFSS